MSEKLVTGGKATEIKKVLPLTNIADLRKRRNEKILEESLKRLRDLANTIRF